jgi:hypothetical protein
VSVTSHASVAVADPVFAGRVLASQDMVTSGGHVIDGESVSCIVINCVHELEFPQSSIAVNVLVMTICGQSVPLTSSENPIVGVASQLSVAVALPVTAVVVVELH